METANNPTDSERKQMVNGVQGVQKNDKHPDSQQGFVDKVANDIKSIPAGKEIDFSYLFKHSKYFDYVALVSDIANLFHDGMPQEEVTRFLRKYSYNAAQSAFNEGQITNLMDGCWHRYQLVKNAPCGDPRLLDNPIQLENEWRILRRFLRGQGFKLGEFDRLLKSHRGQPFWIGISNDLIFFLPAYYMMVKGYAPIFMIDRVYNFLEKRVLDLIYMEGFMESSSASNNIYPEGDRIAYNYSSKRLLIGCSSMANTLLRIRYYPVLRAFTPELLQDSFHRDPEFFSYLLRVSDIDLRDMIAQIILKITIGE